MVVGACGAVEPDRFPKRDVMGCIRDLSNRCLEEDMASTKSFVELIR